MMSLWTVLFALFLSPFFVDAQSTDKCANLDAELVVPDLLGVLTAVGVINLCLCQSQVPAFEQTNVVAILAVTIAGAQVTTDILNQLIDNANTVQTCSYPANAVPNCSTNLCSFTCAAGTTLCSNNECLALCPSAAHRYHRPTPAPCPQGFERCPVGRSLKCVDTQNDLMSCGGCAIGLEAGGRDCSEIRGVNAVSCKQGHCEVESCLQGYRLSDNHRNCVRQRRN